MKIIFTWYLKILLYFTLILKIVFRKPWSNRFLLFDTIKLCSSSLGEYFSKIIFQNCFLKHLHLIFSFSLLLAISPLYSFPFPPTFHHKGARRSIVMLLQLRGLRTNCLWINCLHKTSLSPKKQRIEWSVIYLHNSYREIHGTFLIMRLTPCSGSMISWNAGECRYAGEIEKLNFDRMRDKITFNSAMAKCWPIQVLVPIPNGI